ncbi:hypothetical protein [Streptomyces sp. NPDC007100]|uniref:hypothetical protein n=1 Tax=Streptomyces sp. NPDC007100 TaxID=3155602 RepID=UPI0033D6ECE1
MHLFTPPSRPNATTPSDASATPSDASAAPSDAPTAAAAPDAPPEAPATRHADAPSPSPTSTAAAAFDALYVRHAPDLTRQAIVLTGHCPLSQEAVERSFQTAWQRWPEMAVDPDPPGRIRAMVHEYALSPWHRMRPGMRTAQRPTPKAPAPPPATPPQRALRDAVLSLPAPYRRALLLHDGLGLGLSETAAEIEASTPATAGRLTHARQVIADRLPELGLAQATPVRQGEILRERLAGLAATQPVAPPAAGVVRSGGERTVSRMTQGAFGLTALIAVATTFTLVQEAGTLPGPPAAGPPALASSPTPGAAAKGGRTDQAKAAKVRAEKVRAERARRARAQQAGAPGTARGRAVGAGQGVPQAR